MYFSIMEKYASYPRIPVVRRLPYGHSIAARLRGFLNHPEAAIAYRYIRRRFFLLLNCFRVFRILLGSNEMITYFFTLRIDRIGIMCYPLIRKQRTVAVAG